jgi:Tfp pilus assembly protein PilX
VSRAARAQRGVVLFIALIILVAMSLAGIALMRGVDSGTVIAGNLAFRQNTMFVADLGVEAARAWLQANSGAGLNADQAGRAYYATWGTNTDLLGNDTDAATTPFNWTANGFEVTAAPFTPPTAYRVRYVIHRLCETVGDPSDPAAVCTKSAGAAATTSAGTKGAAVYGSYALSSPVAATYRITVQVTGPRNARSYVQATVF